MINLLFWVVVAALVVGGLIYKTLRDSDKESAALVGERAQIYAELNTLPSYAVKLTVKINKIYTTEAFKPRATYLGGGMGWVTSNSKEVALKYVEKSMAQGFFQIENEFLPLGEVKKAELIAAVAKV